MTNTYRTPIFNLKSVVRETGVKPDTLRAWERRYGLPQPARTEGGHRLYSQRDVDTIKWLVDRRNEGLLIRRAVELWHSLEEAGQEPLRAIAPSPATEAITDNPVDEYRQAWVSACLAFDERGAEQVLTQAFALFPPETVCLKVLLQGIAQVGEGWYEGNVTVQHEHFASALAVRRVEALLLAAPPPTRSGRMVAACPPEEEHVLGLLVLTYLLRRRGWDVLYLGANVPIEQLEEVIRTVKPVLVISTALQLYTAATLLEMAQSLEREGVPLVFGGRIFDRLPALSARIPGHFLGSSLELAPQAVEGVVAASRPAPPPDPVSEAYNQALIHYRERRLLIEADMQGPRPDFLRGSWFPRANQELARGIVAALRLGDMRFLDDSVDWARGMGRRSYVSTEVFDDYLGAYYQAATTHLDGRGAPIVDWLADQVDADDG